MVNIGYLVGIRLVTRRCEVTQAHSCISRFLLQGIQGPLFHDHVHAIVIQRKRRDIHPTPGPYKKRSNTSEGYDGTESKLPCTRIPEFLFKQITVTHGYGNCRFVDITSFGDRIKL